MSRRVLVTGAGSGIGSCVARLLLDRGDEVILLARTDERAEQLSAQFPEISTLVADLAEPSTLHGLGRQLDGGLDGLVHSAGVVALAPVAQMRLSDLEHQLAVNLVAPTVLTREFLPALRAERGTVVFVNSGAGLTANPEWGAYAASKFGLRAVADSLRAEERSNGVAVTSVYPSRTATPMQEQVHAMEGREYRAEDWSRPESVAATVVFALDLPRDSSVHDLTVTPR